MRPMYHLAVTEEEKEEEEDRDYFVAETPEAYTYDDDGNLLTDGRFAYTWNAENRLITMTLQADAVTAGMTDIRLEFLYDANGRRIQKEVWDDTTTPALISRTRFLYDGWNMIAEVDAPGTAPGTSGDMVRGYVWGLDLSGSQQGAGGVGGLLLILKPTGVGTACESYAPAYDGNGNVITLVRIDDGNATAGELAGRYTYDPYGNELYVEAGGDIAQGVTFALANPFRFSTKYKDSETNLLYFGYRFYNAQTGKWINRDPIEERGGVNMYGYVGNEPVDFIDALGLLQDRPLRGPLGGISRAISRAGGLLGSISSGDIFDDAGINPAENFANTCTYVVFINGINNSDEFADFSYRRLLGRLGVNGNQAARIINRTHGFSDLTGDNIDGNIELYDSPLDISQIIFEQLGFVTAAGLRTVRQLEEVARSAEINSCCCYTIHVFAHSQGTAIFRRALDFIPRNIRERISYHGSGGQTQISPHFNLGRVDNIIFDEDIVPRLGSSPLHDGRRYVERGIYPGRIFGSMPMGPDSRMVRHWPLDAPGGLGLTPANNNHSFVPFYLPQYNRDSLQSTCPEGVDGGGR